MRLARIPAAKKNGHRAISAVARWSGRHQVPVAVLPTAKSLSAFSLKPQSDRLLEDAFEQAEKPVADFLRTLLEFMSDDLPAMIHGRIAPEGFDPWREAFRIIQAYETWQSFGDFVTEHQPKTGPGIRERMAFAATVTKAQADASRLVHDKAREHIRQIAAPGTILALPTAPAIAPLADTPAADLEDFRKRVMRLTCTAGMAGLPQMSIPAGTINGCPVGLSFIGWAGGDEALLDLACKLAPHCGMAA